MAINISGLTTPKDQRKVREYINTPQGAIEIYEPTLEDVNAIIDIQRESGFDFNSQFVEFDENVLLTKIFPLLSNIETGDLSAEELQKIVDNPSIHLMIAQNLIAQIISEANKLFAENLKAELASAETALAQSDLVNSIPHIINEHAKRDDDIREALEEINSVTDEVLNLLDDEDEPEQEQTEVKEDDELPVDQRDPSQA
ncbi:hypothetical protein V7094_15480 [Priestia megaterium]|uniref:hypothetical protein n=1 Tax=Priestia megaterium TaxID=1404 RepID=UPI00300071E5